MTCHLLFFQDGLKTLFRALGKLVGKYPKWVIILSVIISLLLSLGAFRIRYLTKFDSLMAPEGCRSYKEEKALKILFPMNKSSNFDVYRAVNRGRLGTVIILSKDGGNVLRESIFSEISTLERTVLSFTIEHNGRTYNYSDICVRNNEDCWANQIMNVAGKMKEVESQVLRIKYPVDLNINALTMNVSAIYLGGVTTDEEGFVLEALALRLFYFLDDSTADKEELALKWEDKFLEIVRQHKVHLITVHRFVSQSFDVEVWKFAIDCLKIGWVSILIIGIFSVASSMTTKWVTSKPLLAVCGCISVGMALISSFGILMLFGVECVPINIAVPFLIMGIGVDDMFILIAAWRRTNPQEETIKRMSDTYSTAAISIAMTSLTNFVSFFVGLITPFPALQIFCVYSGVSVLFDFIYQLTFFGACMALDGERERRNLHPITFRPLAIDCEKTNRGRLYKLLFTDKSETSEASPPQLMIWCRDTLGHWIGKTSFRTAIILVYFAYVAGAAWSLTTLNEGIRHEDIFPYNSYASQYALYYYRYFTEYPHQIQVVINSTLDYSNPAVQNKVMETLNRFHKSPFIYRMDINWLQRYLDFLSNNNFWLYRTGYNISSPKGFIHCLQEVFFTFPLSKMFQQDVLFDEDENHIVASRFVLFTKDVHGYTKEKNLVPNIRSIADSSPLPVIVQNLWWINYEQLLIIGAVTVQSVSIAVGATVFVFFVFLPNLSSVLCVAITIASIAFGTIGYMATFDMTLNSVSVIILVMSIGICVDYSAHIAYVYSASEGNYQERIKQSLFAAAMPIMQGSCSTIFGAISLSLVPSFVLRAFFKIIFLIISFAFLHAIFILPTLLSFWDILSQHYTKLRQRTELPKTEEVLMN